MAEVRSFRGLRYNQRVVGDMARVVSPPYDVIAPEERRRYADASPYNIVRLELPEAQPGDATGEERYERAARSLRTWRAEGVLLQEDQPALYFYEHDFPLGERTLTRRHLIARVRLEDWDRGVVLPHERTMAGPKADRLQLLRACATSVSPIMALYRTGEPSLADVWEIVRTRPPDVAFSDEEGEHRLWVALDPDLQRTVSSRFEDARLYIADGHHRYETALRYRDEQRDARGRVDPEAPFEFTMMVLVEMGDPGLVILPTHRMVHDLDGSVEAMVASIAPYVTREPLASSPEEALDELPRLLRALEQAGQDGTAFGVCGPRPTGFALLRVRDRAAVDRLLPGGRSAAWRSLDVAVLHGLLLEPLVERGARLEFTRSARAAVEAVVAGACSAAFLLNPTRVEQVVAVAEAGDRMPEKSTYFYPKPPTGLVLYPLHEAAPDGHGC
ncbi:MAG TPA: DUF1015 domain-containing protein [Chloroflexota bacterium]